MSPTKADKDEKVEATQTEAEPQTVAVVREVVVSVDVTCRTDDPDVTDDQIAAAAQQQVTLPNTIWIDKPAGGQIAVAVLGGVLAPEEPPVE